MSKYSIKDLAILSGIKPHTIRIWEQRYSIIKPERTNTNIRTYSDLELKKILNISLLLNNGFKISKLANFTENQLISEINNLQFLKSESVQAESDITHLISIMIDYDEEKFDKLFTSSLIRIGFEKTIIEIIYPFLDRVGLLWGTSKISPAQEHFVSNLIRNKIIAASENQRFSKAKNTGFILFLPDNEYHELALLLANFIFKISGFKVIYLGANVPVNCLSETLVKLNSYSLFTHITYPLDKSIVGDLKMLIHQNKHTNFYFSGSFESCSTFTKMKTVSYFSSINDLKKFILTLE